MSDRQPFTFTEDVRTVEDAVYQAIGAASVAWIQPPVGIFDSARARQIAEALVNWLQEAGRPSAQETPVPSRHQPQLTLKLTRPVDPKGGVHAFHPVTEDMTRCDKPIGKTWLATNRDADCVVCLTVTPIEVFEVVDV